MLMKIDFVTPFDSRKSLDRLYKIYDSLNIILQDDFFDVKWYVLSNKKNIILDKQFKNFEYIHVDVKKFPPHGYLRNYYLDNVSDKNQWFYCLDDDNLIHQNFINLKNMSMFDKKIIMFSQQTGFETKRIACKENTFVEKVDVGQLLFKRSFVGDLRFWENVYRNDGYFLMELMFRSKNKDMDIIYNSEIMSFYNAQHWL